MTKMMLLLILLTLLSFATFSCSNSNESTGGGEQIGTDESDVPVEIIIPDSEDFGKGTLSFDKIDYKRPNADALLLKFENTTESVRSGPESFEEQLAAAKDVLGDYSHFLTLYSFITVRHKANIEDSFYRNEYDYLFSAHTSFLKARDDLYVAIADSPYAARFEEEYFGVGHSEKYAIGTRYTDLTVSLLKTEASLEKRYSQLSPATINITSDGIYGSYEAVAAILKERYKDAPEIYDAQMKVATELYENNLRAQKTDVYINLLKVRRMIAESMGYESYADYAYSEIYTAYALEEYEKFLADISDYVIPVYRKLYSHVFMNYFKNNTPTAIDRAHTVNIFANTLMHTNKEIYDAYTFMLHYGLFDFNSENKARYDGSFTLYLNDYQSPVSFVTLSGEITDFTAIASEFGKFLDIFVNLDKESSMDISESTSFGLSLLTLPYLRNHITEKDYKYLLYSEMNKMLLTLIYQGFYAEFEHEAYKLSIGEITKDHLNEIVERISAKMSLNSDVYGDLTDILIEDLFLSPFSTQAYTTSATVALEMYFAECAESGSGLNSFMKLINRDTGSTFDRILYNSGIASPFEDERLKDIVNKIHYTVLGSYFYNSDGGGIVADADYESLIYRPVVAQVKREKDAKFAA